MNLCNQFRLFYPAGVKLPSRVFHPHKLEATRGLRPPHDVTELMRVVPFSRTLPFMMSPLSSIMESNLACKSDNEAKKINILGCAVVRMQQQLA
jgi:hypothetical protein